MAREYDAIVVGLGPGGAGAAVELCRGGARVLVLDGSGARNKPCGGCLSHRWRRLFEWLGGADWLWQQGVEELWLSAPGRPAIHWRTESPGAYLVDRARLDRWLAGRARGAGARVVAQRARWVGTDGPGFRVETRQGAYRSRWLVGADGASGLVARCLGLSYRGLRYLGICEERPLAGHLARVLQGGVVLELGGVPGGYGWIFPREGMVNLGMGRWQRGREGGTRNLARAYARFLGRHGLGRPGAWRGAVIACPGWLRQPPLVRGRALLAGDAAGLSDPFLGEGIGPALYSGRLAGRAILGGRAESYPLWLRRGLLREHFHGRIMARLVYGLGGGTQALARRWPGALELGFRLLRGDMAQGRLWPEAAAHLLGREAALDPRAGGNYIELLR